MLPHAGLAVKRPLRLGSGVYRSSRRDLLLCFRRSTSQARAFSPGQEISSRDIQHASESTIVSAEEAGAPDGPLRATEPSRARPNASTGRDFLSFAYELHNIPPPKGKESKEEKEARFIKRAADAKQLGLLPLPPLPQAPKYPCPYLNEAEIVSYLGPLYGQGWFIGSSEFLKDTRSPQDGAPAPELSKQFYFAREHRAAALAFMESVSQAQTAENHHCSVIADDKSVQIRTHTHSARPPTKSGGGPPPANHPGITLRDVRLAILVEQLFHDHLRNGSALWRSQLPVARAPTRPLTVAGIEHLRRLGRRKSVCPVCKGAHKGVDCPQKDSVSPMRPCSRCGQMHWEFMCSATKPK